MPSQSGRGSVRSDCKHMAVCGAYSLYHCKVFCRQNDKQPIDCKYNQAQGLVSPDVSKMNVTLAYERTDGANKSDTKEPTATDEYPGEEIIPGTGLQEDGEQSPAV